MTRGRVAWRTRAEPIHRQARRVCGDSPRRADARKANTIPARSKIIIAPLTAWNAADESVLTSRTVAVSRRVPVTA
jgi:hypothetical protein